MLKKVFNGVLGGIAALTLVTNAQTFAYTMEFAVIGDAGEKNADSQSVFDSLLRHNVTSLIMPGDNLYFGLFSRPTYEEVWAPWRNAGFTFDVVAIGNHNDGYAKEVAYFNMPGEYFASTYDNLVEYVVLNSDNNDTADSQAQFLDVILSTATAKFVFIVYHHPTYTVSVYHPDIEKLKFQRAIRPILTKHRSKITGLLVGHDHVSLVAHYNDLPVILSGSTHEQRWHYPYNYKIGNMTVKTNWYNDASALWAHLTVDTDSDVAKVDFVRGIDDQSMCTVSIETGKPAVLESNCSR